MMSSLVLLLLTVSYTSAASIITYTGYGDEKCSINATTELRMPLNECYVHPEQPNTGLLSQYVDPNVIILSMFDDIACQTVPVLQSDYELNTCAIATQGYVLLTETVNMTSSDLPLLPFNHLYHPKHHNIHHPKHHHQHHHTHKPVPMAPKPEIAWRPVVLMHGITANASDMIEVEQWIQALYPGIYTLSVNVGDGQFDSIWMDLDVQVQTFAATVQADPNLQQGFNLIGHSQGGVVARGYVERFNTPAVYNMILWSAPAAGQYGIPVFNIPFLDQIFSKILESNNILQALIDQHISFASYWKDPLDYSAYLVDNVFLADLDNEKTIKNSTYKKNMISLNSLTLLYSTVDNVITPKESGIFNFYTIGSATNITDLVDTPLYQQDWLGLRTLDESQRLHRYATDCPHASYPHQECKHWFDLYTAPLLNNTLTGEW